MPGQTACGRPCFFDRILKIDKYELVIPCAEVSVLKNTVRCWCLIQQGRFLNVFREDDRGSKAVLHFVGKVRRLWHTIFLPFQPPGLFYKAP